MSTPISIPKATRATPTAQEANLDSSSIFLRTLSPFFFFSKPNSSYQIWNHPQYHHLCIQRWSKLNHHHQKEISWHELFSESDEATRQTTSPQLSAIHWLIAASKLDSSYGYNDYNSNTVQSRWDLDDSGYKRSRKRAPAPYDTTAPPSTSFGHTPSPFLLHLSPTSPCIHLDYRLYYVMASTCQPKRQGKRHNVALIVEVFTPIGGSAPRTTSHLSPSFSSLESCSIDLLSCSLYSRWCVLCFQDEDGSFGWCWLEWKATRTLEHGRPPPILALRRLTSPLIQIYYLSCLACRPSRSFKASTRPFLPLPSLLSYVHHLGLFLFAFSHRSSLALSRRNQLLAS